jgi:hypothetical protein
MSIQPERWYHKRTPADAVEFRGFAGRTANGYAVIEWLRETFNVEADRISGDRIEYDTGTDDGKTIASPGDRFVPGPENTVHRVKSHMWDELYERGPS